MSDIYEIPWKMYSVYHNWTVLPKNRNTIQDKLTLLPNKLKLKKIISIQEAVLTVGSCHNEMTQKALGLIKK